jgi:hypothetical protein
MTLGPRLPRFPETRRSLRESPATTAWIIQGSLKTQNNQTYSSGQFSKPAKVTTTAITALVQSKVNIARTHAEQTPSSTTIVLRLMAVAKEPVLAQSAGIATPKFAKAPTP